MTDTSISVDARNLFSVRMAKFDVSAGPPKHVDVEFEIQADKSRSTKLVNIEYGKYPDTPLYEGSSTLMSATDETDALLTFDVIKENAWKAVMYTTADNMVGAAGTHASSTWDEIKAWTLQETSKPSIAHTINTL